MEERREKGKELVCIAVVDDWETKAKRWLSTLPKPHTLTTNEVNAWVNSNSSLLPDEFKSLSEIDRFRRLSEMLSSLQSHFRDGKPVNNQGEYPFRFQRSELWRPVYSWLETLDLDDVISPNDISDWVAANPGVCNEILKKHTRHHLMHYVKKCHIKMLKKKKGKNFKPSAATHRPAEHINMPHLSLSIPTNPLTNIPKDSDLYRAKREEAQRKYEILVDLEMKLSGIVSTGNAVVNSMET